MILYYCPECGREEIKDSSPPKDERTLLNIRDGYGRPITHYRCECGNYLAGSININGLTVNENSLDYYRELIKGYNRGGRYYEDGLYEKIEEHYKR